MVDNLAEQGRNLEVQSFAITLPPEKGRIRINTPWKSLSVYVACGIGGASVGWFAPEFTFPGIPLAEIIPLKLATASTGAGIGTLVGLLLPYRINPLKEEINNWLGYSRIK